VNVLHQWAQAALQVKKHATPGGSAYAYANTIGWNRN
jgi:hypothetical protein